MVCRPSFVIKLMLGVILLWSGCGLIYGAGTQLKSQRMLRSLKAGESSLEVHRDWGEPDLRKSIDSQTELWSYASRPNTNDIAATLFYTSTKPGDNSKFIDLKFINGKLVSWNQAKHTVPAKQGTGFSYGLGPTGGASPISHY
jgi:hypothetical protein